MRLFEELCKMLNGLSLIWFKRREGLDAGTEMSANHFSHLLHHDYAERETNNDGSSTSGPLWFHSPPYSFMADFIGKRQRLTNHWGSMNRITPSTSHYGLTSAAAADEGVMRDPAIGSSAGLGQEGEG